MKDNITAIQFFFKNRKLLLLSILVGGIVGIGITFLIPKKYLSTSIIYPVNSYSKDQIITNPQFGFEVEVEQLMQLLESKSMRDRTIEKFNLYDYYELDKNDPKSRSKIDVLYIEDISFFRSKYLSIVIHAKTKSPQFSAAIANFQVDEIDKYRTSIFEENRKSEFSIIESEYLMNQKELLEVRDSIYRVKKGKNKLLFNFIENLDNENYNSEDFVDDPALESIVNRFVFLNAQNKVLNANYEKMKLAINKPLPSVYVIDKAEPSYKSVSNSIFFNGFIGALLSFIVVLVSKLLIGKWNELKNQMIE